MKSIHTLVTVAALFPVAALFLCSPAVLADDSFRPLDTRKRCIVLFRECLVLIDKKDVNGIFEIIARKPSMAAAPNSSAVDLERSATSQQIARTSNLSERAFKAGRWVDCH